jgi:hypothetical protein
LWGNALQSRFRAKQLDGPPDSLSALSKPDLLMRLLLMLLLVMLLVLLLVPASL